jgi:hypothetical protein
MNINLYIERIVLEGLPVEPGQRHLVQAALEAELARLIGENGLPPTLTSGGAWPTLRADGFGMTKETSPAQIGQQIAQSVYGGMK